MEGPLTGIRVLDFGMAAVGPIAAEYLGELGADVIKVESPSGDIVRRGKPTKKGTSHTFLGNNLTKRGIVLDLKDPAGRETALRLIASADVLIENFRSPEVFERLGLGYAKLSAVNPRLIYLQSSAFGSRGPMRGMTSNDWVTQAAGGVTSVNGAPGGQPEFSRGTAAMDWNGAFVNLEALLVALYVRERTGKGMMIETSQFTSTIFASVTRMAEYFATGVAPRPLGSARPNLVPDQAFATSDGYVSVSVPHEGFWAKLCAALARPDLLADARFRTNAGRVAQRDALVPILEGIFRSDSTARWLAKLHAAGVPAGTLQQGPCLSASLLPHPQIQAEQLMSVLDTPNGPMATAEPHWRFDKTVARITRPSPAHGQHQDEVLRELESRSRTQPERRTEHRRARSREARGTLALEGLRVVDVSQGVSGPLCAMQLGDLGAEVIKIEPPGGDWLRVVGPFQGEESALFLQVNRNKRSLAIDLKAPQGRVVLRQLLDGADVLVEGYRPGVMERLGFGYAAVSARNPRLVYCSISGYGSSGPLAQVPATELDVQLFVGTNRHLGTPDAPPRRVGYDLASIAAGMAGLQAIMAALFWRERTGIGQHVETSLLAALVAEHQWVFSAEHEPDSWEGRVIEALTNPPDHGYLTADGPALITLRGDELGWNRFLIAIGRPEVLLDPRFSDPQRIMERLAELPPLVNETLQHWRFEDVRRLVQDELGGTIVRMHDLASLAASEQTRAMAMIRQFDGHATLGSLQTIDVPWSFSEALAALRLPPPVLGQHSEAVLRELGYSTDEVRRWCDEGIVTRWRGAATPA